MKEYRGATMGSQSCSRAGDHGVLPIEWCGGESWTAEEAPDRKESDTNNLMHMLFVCYPSAEESYSNVSEVHIENHSQIVKISVTAIGASEEYKT